MVVLISPKISLSFSPPAGYERSPSNIIVSSVWGVCGRRAPIFICSSKSSRRWLKCLLLHGLRLLVVRPCSCYIGCCCYNCFSSLSPLPLVSAFTSIHKDWPLFRPYLQPNILQSPGPLSILAPPHTFGTASKTLSPGLPYDTGFRAKV